MKKILFFIALLSMSALGFAQSLNNKFDIYAVVSKTHRDGMYRDAFAFVIKPTEKVRMRMYSFEISKADDRTPIYLLEKYTFSVQYGFETIISYVCEDGIESIVNNTNQWIITVKYVNNEDGKDYVKKVITPQNSNINYSVFEDYNEDTNNISNAISNKNRTYIEYTLGGNVAPPNYKGIIIKGGVKYIIKKRKLLIR